MTTSGPTALADERYINLESFKKDGAGEDAGVVRAPSTARSSCTPSGTSYEVKRLQREPPRARRGL